MENLLVKIVPNEFGGYEYTKLLLEYHFQRSTAPVSALVAKAVYLPR